MGSVKSPVQAVKAAFDERGDARAVGPFRAPGAAGVVLTDVGFNVVYANGVALQILAHPRAPEQMDRSLVQQRLKTAFSTERFTSKLPAVHFISGRRRYSCRPFLLDFADDGSDMVALLFERRTRELPELRDIAARFRLSRRECETVGHLVQGLTTKEVAGRMGVSPNTVKQFVRMVMSKMGVTTRSGIVGKLLGH
jgi:DNA-binding CsgD family transcriptional regulator